MTPREELEVRLTALLLGELPEDEAAPLRQTLAQDAELARLYARLERAIGFVQETVAAPVTELNALADAPKLTTERREKLLSAFESPQMTERRRTGGLDWDKLKWREFAALAAMIMALVAVGMTLLSSPTEKRLSFDLSSLPETKRIRGGRAANQDLNLSVEQSGGPSDGRLPVDTASPLPESREVEAFVENKVTERQKDELATKSFDSSGFAQGIPITKQGTTYIGSLLISTGFTASLFGGASGSKVENNSRDLAFIPTQKSQSDFFQNESTRDRANLAGSERAGSGLDGPGPKVGGFVAAAKEPNSGRTGDKQLPAAPANNPGSGASAQQLEQERGFRKSYLARNGENPNGMGEVESAVIEDNIQRNAGNTTFGVVTNAMVANFDFAANDAASAPQKWAAMVPQDGKAFYESAQNLGKGLVADPLQLGRPSVFRFQSKESKAVGVPTQPENFGRSSADPVNGNESNVKLLAAKPDTEGTTADDRVSRSQVALTDGIKDQPMESRTKGVLSVELKRKSGRELDEKTILAGQPGDHLTLSKNRVEIALPEGERGDSSDSFQVATGPVSREALGGNVPSPDSAPRPIPRGTQQRTEELRRKLDSIRLPELQADGLPLAQVIESLGKEARKEDPQNARKAAPISTAGIPQPEIDTAVGPFSTFSLNVSDVSFKLAAASLEKGQMPEPATVRSEEFINAFDYRDPEPTGSAPIAFAWERARYPFAHNRDLLRFSVKTAASGRQPGRPLNLVLLLDNSGSMERADRVRIIQECLRVLAGQLHTQDVISVVSFARTPRLWVDGLPGQQAGELPQRIGELTPQGGTNLEDAMNLAYQTALRHYLAQGVNRVVLLTDGAANLGDVQPESLKQKVEAYRKQGIALDCFGIGWEGLNDELLERLSRNGDGRYGFVNTPEAAATEFAGQLAGALKVAASDVKVQVEFNPRRAMAYRQIGYAKHQLKKEQFRDNTVDAAEIGAAEAGNALYVVQVNPAGEGPIGVVRVRFKVPGTSDYREHEWPVPYEGAARPLEQASPALRLAASASAFSEWLVTSPYAGEVTPDKLLGYLNGVPDASSADPRPKKLEWMIRQAKSVAGK